jgi:hypothetical protein
VFFLGGGGDNCNERTVKKVLTRSEIGSRFAGEI